MVRGRRAFSVVLLALVLIHVQRPSIAAPSSNNQDGARASAVSCTPEKPVAWPNEAIRVRLWTGQPGDPSQYTWSVTAGRIESEGSSALWHFSGVQPGYYTASVRYDSAAGPVVCSVQIVVEESAGARGTRRETGHDLLVKGSEEGEGYGLYSYVLLGAPPDDNSRERYLKLMDAFLRHVPGIADLEKYFERKQLNITYVPIDASAEIPPSAQWLLEHYDYARARFLMRSLQGTREGPYIVSSLQPLSKTATLSGYYLSQDLSSVPPDLVSLWVGEFLNQAAQERFWTESSGKTLVLRLRTSIGILALGLPDVRKALDDWIAWTR
jgi:hypothetical protein